MQPLSSSSHLTECSVPGCSVPELSQLLNCSELSSISSNSTYLGSTQTSGVSTMTVRKMLTYVTFQRKTLVSYVRPESLLCMVVGGLESELCASIIVWTRTDKVALDAEKSTLRLKVWSSLSGESDAHSWMASVAAVSSGKLHRAV